MHKFLLSFWLKTMQMTLFKMTKSGKTFLQMNWAFLEIRNQLSRNLSIQNNDSRNYNSPWMTRYFNGPT